MADNGLTGKLAVITGAAQGIGRAIAEEFLAQGARVVIADLNDDLGRQTAAEIGAGFVHIDVTDSVSVATAIAAATSEHGDIDIWVNDAGIDINAPGEEMTDEQWAKVIQVNLTGTFYCCREIGKLMLARGVGSIVNIASMSGIISNHPQPQCAYNASKAGVAMLTKSLAGEWGTRGVRVNSISPGYTRTAILDQVGRLQPEWTSLWFGNTPMGRPGEVGEIANVVCFVASDKASFMTGSDVVVDGGFTSW
jgi:NAD(P)-dependent dehydrogenase (short-subunit alcohol dehydrogenase family)